MELVPRREGRNEKRRSRGPARNAAEPQLRQKKRRGPGPPLPVLWGVSVTREGRGRRWWRGWALGEILGGVHGGQVGTEGRGLGAQRGQSAVERCGHAVDLGVVLELGAIELPKAKTVGVQVGALDRQRRGTGLVEGDLEVVAMEQVDAVVGGVLRQRVDLRQDVVVVRLQVR